MRLRFKTAGRSEHLHHLCIWPSASYLYDLYVFSLEVCVEELRDWLQQMDESLQKEATLCEASQPGVPDFSTQLKRVEEIHKELLARRFVLMRLITWSLIEATVKCLDFMIFILFKKTQLI